MKKFNALKVKYGANFAATIVVFLAIIIVLNIVVNVLVAKFPIKLDLTTDAKFEFSDQTRDLVKGLKDNIVIYVVGTKASIQSELVETISRYGTASNKIAVKFIDPKTNPTFGKKYVAAGQTLDNGSVIVASGTRFKTYQASDLYVFQNSTDQTTGQTTQNVTGSQAEQKITSAIDYVTSNDQFTAYFANGNGEGALKTFAEKMKNENYTVENINLLSKNLPDSATMLFLFAPTKDYTLDEITKLDKFMQNGGQLLVFMPPALEGTYPNLRAFLNEWGLDFEDDYVVETDQSHYTSVGGTSLSLPDYVTHDITQSLIDSRLKTPIYGSRSVKILVNKTSGLTTSELLRTSNSSFARADYRKNTDVSTKLKTDVDGPFTVAAVASKPDYTKNKVGRVLLVGSDLLLSDENITTVESFGYSDATFAINAANWMQDKKVNLTIAAKSLSADYVTIDAGQKRILMYTAIAIPILVLVAGFIIWFRRRHL